MPSASRPSLGKALLSCMLPELRVIQHKLETPILSLGQVWAAGGWGGLCRGAAGRAGGGARGEAGEVCPGPGRRCVSCRKAVLEELQKKKSYDPRRTPPVMI